MGMRGFRLTPVPRSFVRARAAGIKKLERAAKYMAGSIEFDMDRVAAGYKANAPTATGQMSEAVHVLSQRQDGKSYVVGVGVRMLPNGQEVIAEAGQMTNLHLHEHEHDPAGMRCSTGFAGGWGDSYEQVDVRAMRGGELRSNPRARQWPLGAALVEQFGPVVTEEQAAGFRRGVKNIYRTGVGIVKHTRLGMLLKRAASVVMRGGVLKALLLCLLSGAAYAGRPTPSVTPVEGLAIGDTMFAPLQSPTRGRWYDTNAMVIGPKASTDTPQLFAFVLCLDTANFQETVGLPDSVYGYAVTSDSATGPWRVQWDSYNGDTLWWCDATSAVSDTGCWVFDVPILDVGAKYCKLLVYVAGDTVKVRDVEFSQIR